MKSRDYSTALHQVPTSIEPPEPPVTRVITEARERWHREESEQAWEDFCFAMHHPFWREDLDE